MHRLSVARLAACALAAGLLLAAPVRAEEEPVSATVVARDALALLELPRESLSEYLARVGEHRVVESRDAGFEGRLMQLSRRMHGIPMVLRVAAHDDEVVAIDLELHGGDDDWPALRTAIVEAADKRLVVRRRGVFGGSRMMDGLDRWTRRIEKQLGAAPAVDIPAEQFAHLEVLRSPTTFFRVGSSFGFAGVVPAGRAAATALSDAERYDLLRLALRSPNPEGRVEAARALVLADVRLTDADRRAIAAVRASPISIWKCRGCVVGETTAGELVPRRERR